MQPSSYGMAHEEDPPQRTETEAPGTSGLTRQSGLSEDEVRRLVREEVVAAVAAALRPTGEAPVSSKGELGYTYRNNCSDGGIT